MKETLKSKKGITLITLVITIIILIILAGISIAMLVGEDGVITKAKAAKQNMQNATIEEQERLNALYGEMDSGLVTGSTSNGGTQINPGTTGGGLTAQEHAWLEQLASGGSSTTNGSGLTQQEHDALMRVGNYINPIYDINPNQEDVKFGSLGSSAVVGTYQNATIQVIPCTGYKKISFRWLSTIPYYYSFQLADGTFTTEVTGSGNAWTNYIDIPENAVGFKIHGNVTSYILPFYYSLLVNAT